MQHGVRQKISGANIIYVYLDVSGAIPESIALSYEDFEWMQTLDYEFIPFRCRKCHENGHLYRDFPLTQTPKQSSHKSQPDPEVFTPIPKARKPLPKKTKKGNHAQNQSDINPFASLAQNDTVHETQQQANESTICTNQPEIPERQPEGQTKKQKRNPSPLLLKYTNPIIQNSTAMEATDMEEGSATEAKNPLEGVNLQAIIIVCQAQRQDTILPDLIQKIEWALRKEISKDATLQKQNQGQCILTVQDPDPRHNPKEQRKRGRKSNIEALKNVVALLINSGQIRPVEGFFPQYSTSN
jgi:hypothetical protein